MRKHTYKNALKSAMLLTALLLLLLSPAILGFFLYLLLAWLGAPAWVAAMFALLFVIIIYKVK